MTGVVIPFPTYALQVYLFLVLLHVQPAALRDAVVDLSSRLLLLCVFVCWFVGFLAILGLRLTGSLVFERE
jgi:hypothetical protein